jgi:hypothetical protein
MMCDDIARCLKTDPQFKVWVCDVVREDLKSSILMKVISVVILIASKYSSEICSIIMEIHK